MREPTEQNRAEHASREGEELFRATFEQAAVGMAHVGLVPQLCWMWFGTSTDISGINP